MLFVFPPCFYCRPRAVYMSPPQKPGDQPFIPEKDTLSIEAIEESFLGLIMDAIQPEVDALTSDENRTKDNSLFIVANPEAAELSFKATETLKQIIEGIIRVGVQKIKKQCLEAGGMDGFKKNRVALKFLSDLIRQHFVAELYRARCENLLSYGGNDTLMEGFLSLKTAIGAERYIALSNEILREAEKKGIKPSLLYLDLDHFKSVNDSYGHAVGDLALKHIATVITGALRKKHGDVCVRQGGEEIVILLRGTVEEDACLVAERVRLAAKENPLYVLQVQRRINGQEMEPPDVISEERYLELLKNNHIIRTEEGRGLKTVIPDPREAKKEDKDKKVIAHLIKITLTLSIGVAECPHTRPQAFEQARALADMEVYSAKKAGRDRTYFRGKCVSPDKEEKEDSLIDKITIGIRKKLRDFFRSLANRL